MTRFLPLMLIPAILSAQPAQFEFADSLITKQRSLGSYQLVIYEGEYDGAYRILHNGLPVHSETGYRFRTAHWSDDQAENTFGSDITGDSTANIVIQHWSGGAHCCDTATVFELTSTLKVLGRFYGEDSTPIFKDLDNDGIYEVLMRDGTFAYWNECYAGSPQPELVYRYYGRHYSLAPDILRDQLDDERVRELMGNASRLREEIRIGPEEAGQVGQPPGAWNGMEDAAIRFVNGTDRNERRTKAYFEYESWYWLPSELWGTMLELIYGGRSEMAKKLYVQAWPAGLAGSEQFLADFRSQLSLSPHWTELSNYEGFDF
jgi:hypothetical protein